MSSSSEPKAWRSRMGDLATRLWFALPAIGVFIDGTLSYSLSKVWYDVFHVYWFRMDAPPFCDAEYPCDHTKSSQMELWLATALFLVCAVLNLAAKRHQAQVPSLTSTPGVTAMATGAALGDAMMSWRAELFASSSPSWCDAAAFSDCTYINMTVAVGYTLCGAVAVAAILPLTQHIECGDSAMSDMIENWLETVFRLFMKAICTSVMMLWNSTLTEWSTLGVARPKLLARVVGEGGLMDPATAEAVRWSVELQRIDLLHTHFFWAATVTYFGSIIAARAGSLEAHLKVQLARRRAKIAALAKKNSGGATIGGARIGGAASAAKATAFGGRGWALQLRVLTELSKLTQTTLGWVAGCAWTLVSTDLFPPTYWDPDYDAQGPRVLVYNFLYATTLTALAMLYLLYTGTDPEAVWGADKTRRQDVERSFLTGAMSFFVGWQWIVVVRDVTVVAYRGVGVDAVAAASAGWDMGVATALLVALLFSAAFFWGMNAWHLMNDWVGGSREREESAIKARVEEAAVAEVEAELAVEEAMATASSGSHAA